MDLGGRSAREQITGVLRPWLGLALVLAAFTIHPDFRNTFWTADYLPNILQQAATNIILAVGLTFVILTGGIDLSVGSVLALCGVVIGLTVNGSVPWYLALIAASVPATIVGLWVNARFAILRAALAGTAVFVIASAAIGYVTVGGIRLEGALVIALLLGAGCGVLNGVLVTVGKVPGFIATLGMLTAARGLTLFATQGESVPVPLRMGMLGEGWPVVGIALAVVVLGALFLNRTAPGRYIRAIGGNEESTRLSGVDITAFKTLAYALSGFTAAIAAIVLTSKFLVADTNAGAGAELNAIAAVVIGGTSLSGGRGSVIGSLVGALTIAVLNTGLVIVRVPDTLQGVIIGAVIVLTVMIDQYRGQGQALRLAR